MLQVNNFNISLWLIIKCNYKKHKNTQHCYSNHSKSKVKTKVTTLISLKLTANRLTQDQETRGTESAQLAKLLYCKIYETVEACWPGIQACSKSVMLIKRSLTLGLFYISCLVRLAPAVSFSLAASALNPQVRQLEALWTSTKLNPIF